MLLSWYAFMFMILACKIDLIVSSDRAGKMFIYHKANSNIPECRHNFPPFRTYSWIQKSRIPLQISVFPRKAASQIPHFFPGLLFEGVLRMGTRTPTIVRRPYVCLLFAKMFWRILTLDVIGLIWKIDVQLQSNLGYTNVGAKWTPSHNGGYQRFLGQRSFEVGSGHLRSTC